MHIHHRTQHRMVIIWPMCVSSKLRSNNEQNREKKTLLTEKFVCHLRPTRFLCENMFLNCLLNIVVNTNHQSLWRYLNRAAKATLKEWKINHDVNEHGNGSKTHFPLATRFHFVLSLSSPSSSSSSFSHRFILTNLHIKTKINFASNELRKCAGNCCYVSFIDRQTKTKLNVFHVIMPLSSTYFIYENSEWWQKGWHCQWIKG